MGDAKLRHAVIVLTDRPWDYDAEMRRLGLTPTFVPSAEALLDQLQGQPAGGLVVEVDKVMRAEGIARDQLFQLAYVFPVLRVLRRGLDREVVFLDDPGEFASRVGAFHAREVRHSGRVPVLLHGELANGEDAGFANPVPANILDLSDDGGFVSCPGVFGFGDQVRLRIEGMEDATPLLASIRWCRGESRKRPLHGFGLRFLDIRPGQLRELAARFLGLASGLKGGRQDGEQGGKEAVPSGSA